MYERCRSAKESQTMAKNETGSASANAAKARQGQENKREIRKQRKAIRENRELSQAFQSSRSKVDSAPLHALYKETQRLINRNFISSTPEDVLKNSKEFKHAMALCGRSLCMQRVSFALFGLGMDAQKSVAFISKVFSEKKSGGFANA